MNMELLSVFNHENVLNFFKCFFPALIEMIIFFKVSVILSMQCITLVSFGMLNHPYIPGIIPGHIVISI